MMWVPRLVPAPSRDVGSNPAEIAFVSSTLNVVYSLYVCSTFIPLYVPIFISSVAPVILFYRSFVELMYFPMNSLSRSWPQYVGR